MSEALRFVQSEESLSLYVSSEVAGVGDPWAAFLLAEAAPLSAAGGEMVPSYAWLDCQGYFVFASRPPASQSAFVVAAWEWLARGGHLPGGPMRPYFVWVDDPDAAAGSFAADVIAVDAAPDRDGGRVARSADLHLGRNYRLTVLPEVMVRLDESDPGSPAFSFEAGGGFEFSANGNPVAATPPRAHLPLAGPRRGCLVLDGLLTVTGREALDAEHLDLAIRYFAADDVIRGPGATSSLRGFRYPLLDLGDGTSSLQLEAVLDPARPADPERTCLTCAPQAPIASWLRTPRGRAVSLQPLPGARLLLAPLPSQLPAPPPAAGELYAVPDGRFAALAPDPAMICGSSGTETLSLPGGAVVDFAAGSPALAAFDPGGDATGPAGAYLESAGGSVSTAWLSLTAPQQVTYRAQPEAAALFTASADSPDSPPPPLLDPVALQVWPDPAYPPPSPVPSPAAPIAPLAGIPVTGELSAFREMEAGILAPARRRALLTERPAAPAGTERRAAAKTIWTTDSNGLLVEIDPGRQRLERVRLGVSPGAAIRACRGERAESVADGVSTVLAPATLDLVRLEGDPLTALLGESTFLVATRQGPPGTPRLKLEGEIEVNGWTFAARLPPDTPATLPTAATAMIVKLGGETIATLLDRAPAWRDAGAYNRSPQETRELVRARILHARGDVAAKGKDSPYYDFVTLVDDPSWNGVLILECGLTGLPAAIESTLVGVPGEELAAFHLAVDTSDVALGGGSLTLAHSCVSALVDYENPVPGGGIVRDRSAEHGFLVNHLRARFANSSLASFDCQIGLLVDELFGLNLAPAGGGEPPPPNLLILDGVYQAGDDDPVSGAGTYSFVGLPAKKFRFGYQGVESLGFEVLEALTVSKIEFSPVSRDRTTIVSRFSFWGSLAFADSIPGIDLFNYDELVFSDLGLTMTAPAPGAGAGAPSFALSTAALGFDATVVPGAGTPGSNRVRPGGLVGSLPLTPAKLLHDPEGMTLAGLGFQPLRLVAESAPNVSPSARATTALIFDLPLGGPGALAPAAPLTAQLLAGWDPAGELMLGISMLSLGDGTQLRLEEVLSLGVGDAALDLVDLVAAGKKTVKTVALLLEGASLQVLGRTLPKPPVTFAFTILAPTPGAGVLWSAAMR